MASGSEQAVRLGDLDVEGLAEDGRVWVRSPGGQRYMVVVPREKLRFIRTWLQFERIAATLSARSRTA